MKLSRLALAIALAPSLTLGATDQARESALELPPQVITRATPIQQTTPASVAVIDRQQIDDSAATSLLDLLRSQAGVQIRDIMGAPSSACAASVTMP